MNKPTKKKVVEDMLDFHEMIDFIEKKYNIDVRDYAGQDKQANEYQKEFNVNLYASPRNYGGKYYAHLNNEYVEVDETEYKAAFERYYAEGKKFHEWKKEQEELPYLDYWHYLTDHDFSKVSNPSEQCLYVKEILNSKTAPSWVKEITQYIYDEFKDELTDGEYLKVWIEW